MKSLVSIHSLHRLFWGISAGTVLLAWAIAWFQVGNFRDTLWQHAEQRVQSLARSHAGLAALTLTLADEELRLLRRAYQDNGLPTFLDEAARLSGKESGGPINRAALLDAKGLTIANYLQGNNLGGGTNLADRPYFQGLSKSGEDRLFVTEPILARLTGQWIILFARPVLQDKRFAGLVFVGFEAQHLGFLFDTVDPASELVTILSPEGRIAARSKGVHEHSGKIITLPETAGRNSFLLTSAADGVRRLSAASSIPNWGMRVVAGIDTATLDEQVATYQRFAYLPALLLTLLLIPAALLIHFGTRRQQSTQTNLNREIERSRTVFESMHEGILLLDTSTAVTFSNSAAQGWLPAASGMPFAEAIKKAGFTLVTEDDEPFANDPLRAICLGTKHDIQGLWLKRKSDDLWLALTVRVLHQDNQALEGLLVTLADRGDEHERLTESALNESILTGMPDAVMITDARGRIIKINPAFTLLTGYTAAAIIGQTPAILRSGRHDDAFYSTMWNTLIDQGRWSGRIWNRRQSGDEYCVWHSISAVRNPRGQTARYIAVSRDITEQAAQESDLWQRANFDALTGLANRTRLADRLANARIHALRHGHGFALFYLDLDRFKPVNDTLGHAAGDVLLRQVAQRISAVLREEDMLARIGGDEFALVLPRITGVGEASRVAGKILEVIRTPFDLPEGTVSIGISIGIALYPKDATDDHELTAAADLALYAAKAGGRNRWHFAETAETPPAAA